MTPSARLPVGPAWRSRRPPRCPRPRGLRRRQPLRPPRPARCAAAQAPLPARARAGRRRSDRDRPRGTYAARGLAAGRHGDDVRSPAAERGAAAVRRRGRLSRRRARPGCGLAPALAGARRLAARRTAPRSTPWSTRARVDRPGRAARRARGGRWSRRWPAFGTSRGAGRRYVVGSGGRGLVTFLRDRRRRVDAPARPRLRPEDPGDEPGEPGEEPDDPGDPGDPPPEPPSPPEPCPPLPALTSRAGAGSSRAQTAPMSWRAPGLHERARRRRGDGRAARGRRLRGAARPCPPGLRVPGADSAGRTADGRFAYIAARAGNAGALVAYGTGAERPSPCPAPRPAWRAESARAARCGREARLRRRPPISRSRRTGAFSTPPSPAR